MANFDGITRSSYFKPVDVPAFEAFCEKWGLTYAASDDDPTLFAFFQGDGYISEEQDFEDEQGDWKTENFYDALIPHIADDWWVVIQTAGHEKLRYASGFSVAINAAGDMKTLNMDAIYELLPKGARVTAAEY